MGFSMHNELASQANYNYWKTKFSLRAEFLWGFFVCTQENSNFYEGENAYRSILTMQMDFCLTVQTMKQLILKPTPRTLNTKPAYCDDN